MGWTQLNLIFDIETDGFISEVSTIHCLVIHDLNEAETYTYNNQGTKEPIVRGIQQLADADSIIGHNILGYDNPVISKLYPWFECPATCIDTLLLSRLYHSDMMSLDKKHNWQHMPLKLYGRHSLESYGYRLGEYKGEFAKETDWKDWSEEMEQYCEQDVKVTTKLWNHFKPYLTGSR